MLKCSSSFLEKFGLFGLFYFDLDIFKSINPVLIHTLEGYPSTAQA